VAFSKKGQTPPGMWYALRCLIPTTTTLQQLLVLGAFSSPRQINSNYIPGSPGINIGTALYCHRLLLRLNPLTPNTTCPVAPIPMQSPPTNHITTVMQPRPFHGGFPGKPHTLSIFSLLLSPARNTNTYPAILSPLRSINHITTITGPRPTHGGYPPPALHHPTNHPQTNNSAYPRALKSGGRRRRTPPTTTITDNTSTRTQTIKSGQFTLLNLPPRHQNYTTPPYHRGLPPGAATPPIPPYPWFPQQRWSRLEWARGIGSATPRPPLRRDAVGLRRAATPHLAR